MIPRRRLSKATGTEQKITPFVNWNLSLTFSCVLVKTKCADFSSSKATRKTISSGYVYVMDTLCA